MYEPDSIYLSTKNFLQRSLVVSIAKPVHAKRPTGASRQPSKRTGWSAHVSSSVRHTLPTCQSRRASVLLDHEDHGLDGGDQLKPLGTPAGRAAAAGAVATADGRLEGHHAAPVRVHGGGRISLQSMSDCWIAHSTMLCAIRICPAGPGAAQASRCTLTGRDRAL